MRLIYHPDAEAELIGAARFYEERVTSPGVQFLDTVDHAVATIQEAPERWPVVEQDSGVTCCQDFHTQFTITP